MALRAVRSTPQLPDGAAAIVFDGLVERGGSCGSVFVVGKGEFALAFEFFSLAGGSFLHAFLFFGDELFALFFGFLRAELGDLMAVMEAHRDSAATAEDDDQKDDEEDDEPFGHAAGGGLGGVRWEALVMVGSLFFRTGGHAEA